MELLRKLWVDESFTLYAYGENGACSPIGKDQVINEETGEAYDEHYSFINEDGVGYDFTRWDMMEFYEEW